jgi:S-adenosylmethionine-diacylgycerolhomoserine-N-methlytransferase
MSARIGTDLAGYYRLHAPIYDLTRPLFLFGRTRLVSELARVSVEQGWRTPSILEIGCGTGRNLDLLSRVFPRSRLVGVDLAQPMLQVAQRRLGTRAQLVHGALGSVALDGPFDIVLASYMLSMTGAEQGHCIAAARQQLNTGGLFGVVDFHSTPSAGFARWMAVNHVQFDAQLPQRLAVGGHAIVDQTSRAYGGAWRYFTWVGR